MSLLDVIRKKHHRPETRNVTPEWISELKPDEIFVFGCRNSGRHFDGASAYALKHFGAIMGQREGRQGQSYAIPTVGGEIDLNDIRTSVRRFTKYASEHSELHFFVTPIGCGSGGWSECQIAPLFSKAAKLSNVSIPEDFWVEFKKSIFTRYRDRYRAWWYQKKWRLIYKKNRLIERGINTLLYVLPSKVLYHVLSSERVIKLLSLEEYDLNEGMGSLCPKIIAGNPKYIVYVVNHNTKRTYILRDFEGRFRFKAIDIDWESTKDLPEKVLNRIRKKETPFHSSGILSPGYKNGMACVFWTVSPDGKTYYLDKWYNGPQTDEKNVTLYGFINTECKVVVKMQVVPKEKSEDFIKENRIQPKQ